MDAARTLLVNEGLHGVSVERLCEEAGYTRGAFYSNFESKDELVLALVDRERERMIGLLRDASDPASLAGLAPHEAAVAVIDTFVMLQPSDRDWFLMHLELQLRGLRADVGGEVFVAWYQAVVAGLAEVLEAALDVMSLRFVIPTRDACLVLMGTWDAMVLESLVAGEPHAPSMLRDTLPRILMSLTEPV